MSSEVFDLAHAFKQYFEVVPALSGTLKDEAYRLRHKVYCEDLKFEPPHSDQRETDEYDSCSHALLLRNVQTREYIGCARIIIPPSKNPGYLLPFETVCADTLDRSIIDPRKLCRHRIAEVSRLAVISSYRRRKGEAGKPFGISDDDFKTSQSQRFPYIPISLYLAALAMARLNEIDIIFILTEERLAHHFTKLGFDQKFIGGPVDHHGLRVPSMIYVGETIGNLRANLLPLYLEIAMNIERHLASKQPIDNPI
ncbi:PEP-CTERM/exosortase system-associated acyltransferase [Nitrosospira briensis]|uniref:PEP-CTERM/exosortase system-associated acyltransferase n=1 Tax=Nitrosospira briensis TaxID=35799 RepID=UPI0008F23B4F|nr:PEP-CTERM/exosortase system-associated acyltransferase [Nitrosospira briensis]SFN70399.1 N-acyl amino acid synthase, PEP-CTERM/exosortase system-associated [Nitrosospira briensis]